MSYPNLVLELLSIIRFPYTTEDIINKEIVYLS